MSHHIDLPQASEAYRALIDAAANDPDADVKRKAVNALKVVDKPIDQLITDLKTSSDPVVRKDAVEVIAAIINDYLG